MTPRIHGLLDVAVPVIEGWLGVADPSPREVAVFSGAYTKEDLRALSSVTPAVHLGVLTTHGNENDGAEDERPGDGEVTDGHRPGRRVVEVEYVSTVLARAEHRDLGADRVACALVEILLRRLPEERWGLDVGAARTVRSRNAYTQALAELGFAVWTVNWRQKVRLGSAWPSTPPARPSRLYEIRTEWTGREIVYPVEEAA